MDTSSHNPSNVLLSLDNETCRALVFYVMVLVIKLLFLVFLTGYWRQRNGIYMYPEDVKHFYNGSGDVDKVKPVYTDQDVERVRRNHMNDLENIPVFIFVGLFYLLIDPSAQVAIWHFRVFTFSRIAHTACYQLKLQPWRAYCQFTGLIVTVSMMVQILRAII